MFQAAATLWTVGTVAVVMAPMRAKHRVLYTVLSLFTYGSIYIAAALGAL
jgi:hypothetical protein